MGCKEKARFLQSTHLPASLARVHRAEQHGTEANGQVLARHFVLSGMHGDLLQVIEQRKERGTLGRSSWQLLYVLQESVCTLLLVCVSDRGRRAWRRQAGIRCERLFHNHGRRGTFA